MKKIILILMVGFHFVAQAQKNAYIPLYIQDNTTPEGSQFSWDKTAQSDNFILIWGNTVGTNPADYTAQPNLTFSPTSILADMESFYSTYKNWGFLDDSEGTNLSQYKIPIIMYGTYGPDVAQGFANGGSVDGIIGAFWVHPVAMQTGDVAAHEFAHSLQAQCDLDYRAQNNMGPVWMHSGIFWETHANFLRNLIYPQDVTAWGMDVYHHEIWGDWKNTYENYHLLFGIYESDGMAVINNMWRESYTDEYPLDAYKRLGNFTQAAFNTKMFTHIRRMPTMDFSYNNLGVLLRQYRTADLQGWLPSIQNCHNILRLVPGSTNRYEIPIEQAPEEYAYNIIPLYRDPESCSVIVQFKGHTDANSHAGWRYGFVAANADGSVSQYSETFSANSAEIAYETNDDETALYLVVMGAPNDVITTNADNDTWHGYPKHYRFPYEVAITGAVPEGHQPAANFRAALKTDGHLHSNGGGWVQNSATVAQSVFVAPYAIILGTTQLSGNAVVGGTAIVRDAIISGSVHIDGNAVVSGGTLNGNAIVRGQSFVENATMSGDALVHMRARVSNYSLSGTVEVGGDVMVYNAEGSCDNGVYYKMTNFYEDNLLECDGRTATHPSNSDVNTTYSLFTAEEMAVNCTCQTLPECLSLGTGQIDILPQLMAVPNPANGLLTIILPGVESDIKVYNSLGALVAVPVQRTDAGYQLDVSTIAGGIYYVRTISDKKSLAVKLVVAH